MLRSRFSLTHLLVLFIMCFVYIFCYNSVYSRNALFCETNLKIKTVPPQLDIPFPTERKEHRFWMIINIRNHKLLFAPQSDSLPPPYRCQTIKTHKNVQVKNHLSAYKYCLCERQQLTGRYVDNFIGHLFYCLLQIYDSVRPLLGRKKGIAGHFPPSLQLGKSEQLKISGCITFQL